MSFFDDASLVFLPSGQAGKDGKAYSMKPTDGSGDFTFSRGSNLTATRVDSNGLIEKGRENLLLQSNQFDTTWGLNGTSVTSGQSGYDGTNDAWLLNSTTTGFPRISQNVTSSGVATYSIYAKAATDGFIQMRTFGADVDAWFDLDNGVVANESGAQFLFSNIESVGNGYYRCSVTFNGSLTSLRVYPASAYGVYSTSGNGVYIQDAQVEIGLAVTEPILSGATTGLAGILEDSPRFDYSGGASCSSLLLEPSRTNLVTYSEYFDGWSASGGVIKTPNATTSTEGVTNAYKMIPPSGTATNVYIYQNVAGDSFSIFAKAGEKTKLLIYSGVNGSNAYFDLSSGQVLTTLSDVATADIEAIGADGWYRCSVTWNTTSTRIRVYVVDADNSTSVTGNRSDGLFIYGAQVEQGSYPTSYIPNHSGSGSVTREGDSFEKTGLSSVIGQTEGTIFFEFEYSHQAVNIPFFRILEDGSNFYEIIALSSFKLRSRARIGGSIVAAIDTSSVVSEGTHKAAIIYKSRDYKFYLDGSLVGSSTENSIVSNPSEINYFNNNNNLKQFLIFPTALPDNQCITLTS